MPNWCNCVLKIKGEPDELEDFNQSMKTPGTLKFQDFVPVPEKVTATSDVIDWRYTNWGTKWDLSDNDDQLMNRSYDGTVLSFTFQTAWGPPKPFIETVSEQFPHLEFCISYYEPLGAFAGYVGYIDGCENDHTYCEWESDGEYNRAYMDTPEQYKAAWEAPAEYNESDEESTSAEED